MLPVPGNSLLIQSTGNTACFSTLYSTDIPKCWYRETASGLALQSGFSSKETQFTGWGYALHVDDHYTAQSSQESTESAEEFPFGSTFFVPRRKNWWEAYTVFWATAMTQKTRVHSLVSIHIWYRSEKPWNSYNPFLKEFSFPAPVLHVHR